MGTWESHLLRSCISAYIILPLSLIKTYAGTEFWVESNFPQNYEVNDALFSVYMLLLLLMSK